MNVNSVIRKYFFDNLSQFYPVFDKRQGTLNANLCYLIPNQSKSIEEANKCQQVNVCNIEIEVIQRQEASSNAISSLTIEGMEQKVIDAYNSINLPNFVITNKSYTSQSLNAEVSQDKVNRILISINLNLWKNE